MIDVTFIMVILNLVTSPSNIRIQINLFKYRDTFSLPRNPRSPGMGRNSTGNLPAAGPTEMVFPQG